jgi:hypothetical protein
MKPNQSQTQPTHSDFKPVDDVQAQDSVIAFNGHSIFKIKDILSKMQKSFQFPGLQHLEELLIKSHQGSIPSYGNPWFNQGIPCELMHPHDAKGWRKGKIRIKISFEFLPDEPDDEPPQTPEPQADCPLDELRQATRVC